MNTVTRKAPEQAPSQVVAGEWVTFPGGELEGKRPKVLCPACRRMLQEGVARRRALCFQCYRASLERDRALKAAGDLDTASVERFQSVLPFEPVHSRRPVRSPVPRPRVEGQAAARIGWTRL